MSVSDEEARIYADRVNRYINGTESLDKIYGDIHPDELGVYHADNRKLVLWAIEELARRDAESEKLRALVSKLRNYDACNDSDIDEAACAIERLAGLDCGGT